MYKPCKFVFDESPVFHGFEHGETWNGFDCVFVTPEERDRIVAWIRSDGDNDTADEMMEITPMEDGNISLGWGYITTIVSATRYIVRDKETKGADFLMWGDDDPAAAQVTLAQARADGLDVELVTMPSRDMDEWTAKLIGDQ